MAPKEGFHWHRRAWQPNGRQREVLDLLLEGRTNAEIAVRLGITVDGAKWHVGELLSQTGCEDRQALASWWREERERRPAAFPWTILARPALRYAAGVSALAVLVALALIVLRTGSDGGNGSINPEAAADFPVPTATPERETARDLDEGDPCALLAPDGYRAVSANELLAEGLIEVGQVIEPHACPLLVSNRADQAFVWMADGGEIDLTGAAFHRVTSFGSYGGSNYLPSDVGFYFEGEQYRASLWVQDEDGPVFTGRSSANVEVRADSPDRVTIVRTGSNGAYISASLEGETSGDRRIAFDSEGRLFFDPRPLPGDLATNWLTGEQISTEGWRAAGQISLQGKDGLRTDCWVERGTCSVYFDGLGYDRMSGATAPPSLTAPVGGVLRCVPAESAGTQVLTYELEADGYVLRLSAFGGYAEAWAGGCPSRPVSAGEKLDVWVYTQVEALEPDGSPLSIVATRDGRLFIGEPSLFLDCPCSPRK